MHQYIYIYQHTVVLKDSDSEQESDDEEETKIDPLIDPLRALKLNNQESSSIEKSEMTLGLLDYLLRLSVLETCEQIPHIFVKDELVNLYLVNNALGKQIKITKEDEESRPASQNTPRASNSSPSISRAASQGSIEKRNKFLDRLKGME